MSTGRSGEVGAPRREAGRAAVVSRESAGARRVLRAGQLTRLAALLLVSLGVEVSAQPTVPVARPELSGAIAGRVCRDLNRDGVCSADEPGVVSVRVVLETGQSALTDANGRYHLAAVGAREPDFTASGRLLPGRHRVKVDVRTLAPGSTVTPTGATVEVSIAALQLRDFAVQLPEVERPTAAIAHARQPPSALPLAGDQARFLVTGMATAGASVRVNGEPAEVDPGGAYRAWVVVVPGENDVSVTVRSASGAISLFRQRVDVVKRSEGLLIVPRALTPAATLQLPSTEREPAAAGQSMIRVEGAPGTRVFHPAGEVEIGASGAADLPVELRAGPNELALRVQPPGQPARDTQVSISAVPRPLVVGLLDLEATFAPSGGSFRLFGRGAAHFEHRILGWKLTGELELDDTDVTSWRDGALRTLVLPRRPDRLERALDPEQYPWQWGDDSTGQVPNEAGGRLRLEASHDRFGRVGFGTWRALFADSEIGRYHRELFGPYAELSLPLGDALELGASGFFSPSATDPTRPLHTTPVHEELRATGGSVYYLGNFGVAQGSELVRVVVRDGLTRMPIAERHLVRGRDYEIDYGSGRILLARPLSFIDGEIVLRAEPLTSAPEPVLEVDYERLELGGAPRQLAGGEVRGRYHDWKLALGMVNERGGAGYELYRGNAAIPLGPLTLHVEAAQSRGQALPDGAFALSDDGGLSFLRSGVPTVDEGQAIGVRLRGPGITARGLIDASFRRRTAGFSDGSHQDVVPLRQASLRAREQLGPVSVALLVDDQSAVDPRLPFSDRTVSSRVLGGALGYTFGAFGLQLEVKDSELTAAESLSSDTRLTGGRTSAGLAASLRVADWLRLSAAHKQRLLTRGEGLGAVDDTFTSVGAEWLRGDRTLLGARVGYGPALGPQAFAYGAIERDDDTFYGTHSVDVDGPNFGAARSVFGARTRVDDRTAVFVEDVAAHDANAVRLSRAVGLSQELGAGFTLSARYERGVRPLLDTLPSLRRDAGGLGASWRTERVALYGRAELRSERGESLLGLPAPVSRLQRVLSLAADVKLLDNLRASGRLNWVDSVNLDVTEALLLEGSAGLSYRLPSTLWVLHYGIERELAPGERATFGQRTVQSVSLMPAFQLGSRLTIGAGAHAGWSTAFGDTSMVLSGSIRPTVRIWGGLELGAEAAARTSAAADESLTALRGEVGYRFGEFAALAVGYTFFGFSGNGLPTLDDAQNDRLYLRAELAY